MPERAPRTVAVLLAGGVGARIGVGIPKQLLKVAGRSLLEHSLLALHRHPGVDEVVVMMATGHLDAVRAVVAAGEYPKVTAIREGGATRSETTRLALADLDDDDRVLLHDAVRPLVSQRVIGDCLRALDHHDAVDVAVPSADSIIEVDPPGGSATLPTIAGVPVRGRLRRGQTPQAFRVGVLRAAYEAAAADPGFVSTDECSVVLRYAPEVPVAVVAGEEANAKVTEPVDLYLADRLIRLTHRDVPRAPASAEAYRTALEGRTVVVLGGSYGIGAEVARQAAEHGAAVLSFSRSTTGTHVERRADLVAAAERALSETGRIDYVVNAAGVLPTGSLEEADDDLVATATAVNYLAPVLLAQTFHPHLAATGGSLLLFTSSSHTRGRGGYALYSSAKAAVVNLTLALADEWASDGAGGVRVNCLNPERTATPMRSQAFGEEPPGSLLDAVAVGRAALDVLVSDDTGHVVDVRRDDPLELFVPPEGS